jgi:hypothetical protein
MCIFGKNCGYFGITYYSKIVLRGFLIRGFLHPLLYYLLTALFKVYATKRDVYMIV